MRDSKNIAELAKLDIDALGFIFSPDSKRYVAQKPDLFPTQGKLRVGVFVNAPLQELEEKITAYDLLLLQLHGQESPEYCQAAQELGVPVMKAFAVDAHFDFEETEAYAPYCRYFLFDTKGALPGGNGRAFDWSCLQNYQGATPFFLSGGLRPALLEQVLQFEHPRCVGLDLNSGFEQRPAYKDITQIQAFISQLQQSFAL